MVVPKNQNRVGKFNPLRIMKTLDLKQMEDVSAGWQDALGCAMGIASMVTTIGAATVITGGWAIAAFAVGWLGGGISAGLGCGGVLAGSEMT